MEKLTFENVKDYSDVEINVIVIDKYDIINDQYMIIYHNNHLILITCEFDWYDSNEKYEYVNAEVVRVISTNCTIKEADELLKLYNSVGLSANTIVLSNKPHTYNKMNIDIEEWLNAEAVLLIIY